MATRMPPITSTPPATWPGRCFRPAPAPRPRPRRPAGCNTQCPRAPGRFCPRPGSRTRTRKRNSPPRIQDARDQGRGNLGPGQQAGLGHGKGQGIEQAQAKGRHIKAQGRHLAGALAHEQRVETEAERAAQGPEVAAVDAQPGQALPVAPADQNDHARQHNQHPGQAARVMGSP